MAGSAYVLKGGALSGNITLASLRAGDYRIDGAKTQDGAGWSVAISPDLNGDGIGDVLLGAPGVDRASGPDAGAGPQQRRPAGVDRRRVRRLRRPRPRPTSTSARWPARASC